MSLTRKRRRNVFEWLERISNPSFLTVSGNGERVYAVGEDSEEGSTANALSFDREAGRLKLLNSMFTGGGAPCNITLSPREDYVLTANYMGGSISVFPLDADGQLKESHVIRFEGKGRIRSVSHSRIYIVFCLRLIPNGCWPMTWEQTGFTYFL